MSKQTTSAVVEHKKPFELVDMTVSKKELLSSVIEIQQVSMQEKMDEISEKIEELQDSSTLLTKDVMAKVKKEVQSHSSVKAVLSANSKLDSLRRQEDRTSKVTCDVDANHRNGDFNVSAKVSANGVSLFFGTSETRKMCGTLDLNKVSQTAKKVDQEMRKRMTQVEKLEKQLADMTKQMTTFSRNAVKWKHKFNKTLLSQTPEGRQILAQLEEYEKELKK
jgi:hypothetical protein